MLSLSSTLLIGIFTFYFSNKAKTHHTQINEITGKCLSMVISMLSASTIGVILAVPLKGELAYSSVLAMVIGIIIGIFISKSFGLHSIIESSAASLMGAMMGAMLGEMLSGDQIAFMLISLDVLYLISIYSAVSIINKENKLNSLTTRPQKTALFTIVFLPLLVIGIVAFVENQINNHGNLNTPLQHQHSHGEH